MGGMVLIVSQWLPTGEGYHDMALRFFMQVVTGGIIYVTLVSLFWVMAGATDDAAEAQIWRSISAALERVATILQFSRRPVG
jgi:hypothetical protein